ncbi:uncharacterized protein STEHIDRAFT_121291 [Stereum hirsutum FP-91666 SS1]|uniref:uncharacterized protein n=1 Tax=Stereum hirsutum (strain FP-91666) TaxID=721885 RepID=UPI000440D820|nr:uncharacterized protein STEHIDRAFT_121291 [Stereum hirsutum FP-91666 SS1]EIM87680.1 hypothetical protein STEHIDRAFT_121291 [Stereum hirsutum FP-91666 SS1]
MTFLQKKTVVLAPTSESCPFTKKYLTMAGSVTLGRQSSTQASTASNGLFAIAGQSGSETDDLPVSPLHAELFIQNGALLIKDCGSTYGTWVDGEVISGPTVIRSGSVIELGSAIERSANTPSSVSDSSLRPIVARVSILG